MNCCRVAIASGFVLSDLGLDTRHHGTQEPRGGRAPRPVLIGALRSTGLRSTELRSTGLRAQQRNDKRPLPIGSGRLVWACFHPRFIKVCPTFCCDSKTSCDEPIFYAAINFRRRLEQRRRVVAIWGRSCSSFERAGCRRWARIEAVRWRCCGPARAADCVRSGFASGDRR